MLSAMHAANVAPVTASFHLQLHGTHTKAYMISREKVICYQLEFGK